MIDRLIEGSQDAQFGPLIGKEDQGAFDLELLRETIVRMPMEEDSRADLLAHLAEYRDER